MNSAYDSAVSDRCFEELICNIAFEKSCHIFHQPTIQFARRSILKSDQNLNCRNIY